MPVEIKDYSVGDSKKVDYAKPKGKVTVKKAGFRSLGEGLSKDAFSDFKDYALEQLIIPGAKNLIWDLGTSLLRTILWKDASSAGPTSSDIQHVPYSSISNLSKVGRLGPNQSTVKKLKPRAEDGFIFENKSDADIALSRLKESCESFGVVSVQALYDICGKTAPYTANNYGWMNLDEAYIDTTREGYILRMPRSVPLD